MLNSLEDIIKSIEEEEKNGLFPNHPTQAIKILTEELLKLKSQLGL